MTYTDSVLVELSFTAPQIFQNFVSDCLAGMTRDLVSMRDNCMHLLGFLLWWFQIRAVVKKVAVVVGREAVTIVRYEVQGSER